MTATGCMQPKGKQVVRARAAIAEVDRGDLKGDATTVARGGVRAHPSKI